MRDINAFRERYKHWKETGELPYKAGRVIEQAEGNLPLPTYRGGKSQNTAQIIYEKLRNLGFDHNSSVGILGNMLAESSFNVNAMHPNKTYHGLALNSTAIKNEIVKQYGNYDMDAQLQAISDWADRKKWVLNTKNIVTNSGRFKKSGYKSPQEAAELFMKLYERPVVYENGVLVPGKYQKHKERVQGAINLNRTIRPLKKTDNELIAEQDTGIARSDYDYKTAIASGATKDETGHWPSRVPETGLILKRPWHPTVLKATTTDASMGYYPYLQNGDIYTNTWLGNQNIIDAFNLMLQDELPLSIHKMDKGTEPKIEYVDDVKVDPITGEAIMSDNTRGSVILPELTVRPQHLTKSAFDGYTRYLDDFVGFVPIAGDINDGINAGIALQNRDYSQAALLGAGLLLPNVLEKPLRAGYKATKRFLNGSTITDRMVGAMSDLNFTRAWNDDVYARWLLNGQKTPDFNVVYHGRKTYRGKPEDALRTYSDRDVGLHLTENEETARRFAKENGVIYKAIDKGIYPDAIYPDLGEWDAQVWKHNLDKAEKLTPELEKEALRYFKAATVDKLYGPYKAVQNILRDHNISLEDIQRMSRLHIFSRTDAEKLAANKEFADFLSRKGVNFRYKNDFEGGGFLKPSIFITDTSDLLWIPEILMAEKQKRILPLLNWKTGQIERGTTSFPEYIEKFSNYNNGKSPKIK